jgi:hypothetical protein
MANQEQLEIVKMGSKEWSMWRKNNHGVRLDLREAELHNMDLCAVDLSEVDLRSTSFIGSELMNANFYKAILVGADLSRTELSGAVFYRAYLDNVNLDRAWLTATSFRDVDLSTARGLTTVTHYQPSSIGFDTIQKSQGKIPEVFLRGCGLNEFEINFGKLFKSGMDRSEVIEITNKLVDLYGRDT